MEANRDIREMVNIKKADSLSTLKENDKNGNEEGRLNKNGAPKISTDNAEINPAIDPRIAKQFPHQFAHLSFFMNIKEPAAPIVHRRSAPMKIFDELSIILFFQVFEVDGKVLFWGMVDLQEFESSQE